MATPSRPLTSSTAAPVTGCDAPIRVAIVDDCQEVRFLLATVIELDPRFEVVAEASDAKTALVSVAASEPDLVLVDLRLGSDSGTSLIRRLRRRGTTACLVVITASASPRDHGAAFAAGADAIQGKHSMTCTMVDDLAVLVARRGSPTTTFAQLTVRPSRTSGERPMTMEAARR